MLPRINHLMEENEDEEINLEEFNDQKNEKYKNKIMKKKLSNIIILIKMIKCLYSSIRRTD